MRYDIQRKEKDTHGLKTARLHAHRVFDQIWKTKYQQTQAYRWLAKQMRLTERETHFAFFDISQCQEAVRLVQELRPVIEDRDPAIKRFERVRR